ncbi:MID1 family protein [Aspergillus ibericus CBS 121593]|uniref:Cora family metal ion transporter n=1 Tax=Aspergillus ibericus CBS 121593 TaxID=1448316 RepID=A0A395HD90_9EURO|nr:cora family metal ion transporter [Aspergillus ibericus CBS 121593]RAL05636.1 cora family metal ion transporter [Aspergillus ibericus CBS 121593]
MFVSLVPPHLQCRLRAAVRAVLYCAIGLAICVGSVAAADDDSDSTSLASKNHGRFIFGDASPQFSFPLAAYNGLEFEDAVDEEGKSRGLDLVRRAPAGVSSLGNNQYQQSTIKMGATEWWYFPVNSDGTNSTSENESRDLSKRSTTVYLSLTACSKPSLNRTDSTTTAAVPQLTVYASESVQKPGPDKPASNQTAQSAEEGYMGMVLSVDRDVYIGVTAPNSTEYSGSFTYQLAASTDAYFHSVDDTDQFLFLVDSDTNAALLTTKNLTTTDLTPQNYSHWMDRTPPYTMFANNLNSTSISGLERSYCALDQLAQIGKSNVETSMTTRGSVVRPTEQFYITGLNRTSTYYGIMARNGNSTSAGNGIIGGGGKVWPRMNFTTKTDDNCAVVYDLPFCSEVAYAVPSNPSVNMTELRKIYDDNAASLYQNFNYSMQQVQCNTSSENMFSLAVTCDSCADAYKQWLCAVTIPRCADFSSDATFLQIRNAGQAFLNGTSITNSSLLDKPATNRSRNPLIDKDIRPGPYKEVLPCLDVCHSLVRNCPSILGFSCPIGQWANVSYGVRDPNGDITCSYLGAAYYLNAVSSVHESVWISLYMVIGIWTLFWVLG